MDLGTLLVVAFGLVLMIVLMGWINRATQINRPGGSAAVPAKSGQGPEEVVLGAAAEQRVRQLVAGGDRAAAATEIQEATGLDLAAAKLFVEAIETRYADVRDVAMDSDEAERVRGLIADDDRSGAAEVIREATGLGVAEAKDLTEAMAGGHVPPAAGEERSATE